MYDERPLSRTTTFLADEGTGEPEVSAASVPEAAVVRWLLKDGPAADYVRGRFASGGPVRLAFEVEGRMVEGARIGDVDVVMGGEPERALAVECKRLLVKARYHAGAEPGKIREMKKGCRQATELWRMGFHRAALVLIVQTEGWEGEDRGAYVYRGARPHHFDAALNHPSVRMLPVEVGLVLVEVIHATRRPIGEAGAVGVHVVRSGASQPQPMGRTDRVREAWADPRWR